MTVKRCRICLCIAVVSFVMFLGRCSAAELSRADIQTVYREPVAVAAVTDMAPVIDGDISDDVWNKSEWLEFDWVDPEVAGYPMSWCRVRLLCDRDALYALFFMYELGNPRRKTAKDSSPAIVKDDHITMVLQAEGLKFGGNPLVVIKTNFRGAAFVQLVSGTSGRRLDSIEGLDAAVKGYPARRWAHEIKIPFSLLFEEGTDVPAVWKANFFRRRYYHKWSNVKPGMTGYSVWWTSWVMDPAIPYFQPHTSKGKSLNKMGMLYLPVGSGIPAEIKALTPGAGAALEKKKTDEAEKAKKTPAPGFKVSLYDLEQYLQGPAAYVRHTDTPPEIRGDLSDPAWRRVPPLELKYMHLSLKHKKVTKNPTYTYILSDNRYLYLGFDCKEQFMKDAHTEGALWRTESLDIFIDPGRTEDNLYYQFSIGITGQHRAKRMKNVRHWNPKSLKVKTEKKKDGWTAEMRISFEDLGIEEGKNYKWWGANFYRVRWAKRSIADDSPGWDNWDTAWRPNPLGTPHAPEWWGHLYFEKADLVKPHLEKFLNHKGLTPAGMGLTLYDPKEEKPVRTFEQTGFSFKKKQAGFSRGPKVSRQGNSAVIEFSTDTNTDVTVAVTGPDGKTVRHLAAGVLGENPPKPLQPGTLSQKLVWDGKDDDGKPVDMGKCKIRVGLGLSAEFERVIGWRPSIPRINSLAVDEKGDLYVFSGGVAVDHGHGPGNSIRVYSRDGRYRRTVHPFPGSLKTEQVRGANAIPTPDGGFIPVLYQSLNKSWLPHTPAIPEQQAVLTNDGHIILANTIMRGMYHGRMLLKLGVDGSAPPDCVGPRLTFYQTEGDMVLALSPDEKYVYVTGLRGKYMWDGGFNHHCVYRVTWNEPELADEFRKPFIGEFQKPGKDPEHLNNPSGLAVDADGNIIVADSGNGRLAVFRPDGSPLKQIPLKGAEKVVLDKKRGTVYALAYPRKGGRSLVKLKSIDDPAEQARLGLRFHRIMPLIAVDANADPVILWTSNGDKVLDTGTKLKLANNLKRMNSGPYDPVGVRFESNIMAIDRERQELIAGKWHVFDCKTGKFLRNLKLGRGAHGWGGEIAVGKDGTYFVRGGGGANFLVRFSRTGKRIPFDNGKRQIDKLYGGHGNSNRGHCVAPNGDIYYLHHYVPHGNTKLCVSHIAPDGTVKRFRYINDKLTSGCGIKADKDGCVYIGLSVKPREEYIPSFFKNRLPEEGRGPHPWFYYRQYYGSIVKFRPEGGEVVSDPNGTYTATNYSNFHGCSIKGAEWVHYGFSPCHQKDIESSRCSCETSRFDLDGFARCFIPDVLTSTVDVIDSSGNRIMRFGGWGNMDARGPDSPNPKPEIAMAWGILVFVDDTAVYIGDLVNSRIVKAELTFAAKEDLEVK